VLPLALTADPLLAAELGRAGLLVRPSAGAEQWQAAPLVVVGDDVADRCGGLPRRPGVALAVHGRAGEGTWRRAVAVGAEHVVELPEAAEWLVARVSACSGRAGGAVVAVVGACGGAGASALAVALGLVAARPDRPTVLVDGDPWGGGLDLAVGLEGVPGVRWSDVAGARGPVSAEVLAAGLPVARGLAVLSWGRVGPTEVTPEVWAAVLLAARQAYELVVVDLPRNADVLGQVDEVLLVVPDRVRAVAAAARVVERCGQVEVPVRLVRRGRARRHGVGLAEALGLPVAGGLTDDRQWGRCQEQGRPRAGGPVLALAAALLATREAA
jgi:secretion/DNA translocation related CpaE-like protein